jgi:hypothetical protein
MLITIRYEGSLMFFFHPFHVSHFGISESAAEMPCPACEGRSLWLYGSSLSCHRCGWHSSQTTQRGARRQVLRRWLRLLKNRFRKESAKDASKSEP